MSETTDGKPLSWTQPICDECFLERRPGRVPVRLLEPNEETCVDCGHPTHSGIYYRVYPATASYPTNLKDD